MKTTVFEDKVLSLSDRIYPMVARMLANRENAEDAVQEIMLKLWDRRKEFQNHPNISGFVFLTARNYCLDQLKKKHPDMDMTDSHLQVLRSSLGNNQMEWEELNGIVKELLKTLPAQQCEIMMMRDMDGLEFEEIAEATQLNVAHIRVVLSRARKQVRTKLKQIYSYE